MNFTEIDILEKLVVFSDGEPTVAYFEQVLGELNASTVEKQEKVIQPVSLLILDLNMPYNGLEAIKSIKNLYEKTNARLRKG